MIEFVPLLERIVLTDFRNIEFNMASKKAFNSDF